MENRFAQHWAVAEFIKFALPLIMGLITISVYMMVDAVFVSRFAGPLALAAVNIIMPLFNLGIGLAIMVAAGSSAVIGFEMGEGNSEKANRHFSLVFCFLLAVMIAFFWGGQAWGIEKIARLLGASPALLPYCTDYLGVFIFGISAVLLQLFFEYFIRLDGKPLWAFFITLASGLTNVVLDYWLIAELGMGIKGAGIASSAGILVAVILGSLYFCFFSVHLKPSRPVIDCKFLGRVLVNGSSEMATEVSSGVKILVFNLIIIQYAGESGVAAIAILMNLYFVLSAFHIGLIMGVAPVVSFNFGAQNFSKIRQLVGQALTASLGASLLVFAFARFQGLHLIRMFTANGHVFRLTADGLKIFGFTFLVNGITILASGFFTAAGNGKISALIACLNSFVFTLGFVSLLPGFLGLTGVWISIPLAETIAMCLSVAFFIKYKGVYLVPTPQDASKRIHPYC